MVSRKYTIATVIAGMIATLAIGAIASISFSTAAFAAGGQNAKSPQCPTGGAGGGNPHDGTEISGNPHDTPQGFPTGNPHDACTGS